MKPDVTVRTFPYRSDAEVAKLRLAADGIASWVFVDDEGGLNPGFYSTYGVRLVTARVDLDDALTSLGIERIPLAAPLAEGIMRHAIASMPNEACGLVLFDETGPVFVCPLSNQVASERRFTISPEEHHGAWRFGARRGWDVGAMFHSHPRSEAFPSAADLTGGGDQGWVHLIVGPVAGRSPVIRGFRFAGHDITELAVVIGA